MNHIQNDTDRLQFWELNSSIIWNGGVEAVESIVCDTNLHPRSYFNSTYITLGWKIPSTRVIIGQGMMHNAGIQC